MNIRPAQEHEAEALSALALKAKAYWGYSADTIELWRQDLSVSSDTITSRPTFVAAVGDEIAGFYSLVHRITPGNSTIFGSCHSSWTAVSGEHWWLTLSRPLFAAAPPA